MGAAESSAQSAGQYAAGAETLRSTVRWLLAALAGIGAVLVGGLQLTGLGELGRGDLPRLGAALAALVGAVVAAGYMIREAARILTVEWVSLAHLDNTLFEGLLRDGRSGGLNPAEVVDLAARIDDLRDELYAHAAPTVAELHRRLGETNALAARIAAGEEAASSSEQARVVERARELRAAAREVVDYANYERTRRLFTQLGGRLVRGAIVAVVFLTGFAYATNPPPPENKPLKVEIISGATP